MSSQALCTTPSCSAPCKNSLVFFEVRGVIQVEDTDDPPILYHHVHTDVQIRPSQYLPAPHMEHPAAEQRVQPVVFAAGDKHLSAADAVQYIFLPPGIQLRLSTSSSSITGYSPMAFLCISRSASFRLSAAVRTCPCEQNCRALRPLTSTSISSLWAPERHSFDAQLRRLMALHMRRQRRVNICLTAQRVGDGPDGLVRQGQLLPSRRCTHSVPVGHIPPAPHRTAPDSLTSTAPLPGTGLRLNSGSSVQKLWLVLAVPQDAGLVLIQPAVLGSAPRHTAAAAGTATGP